jgi:DNA-binding IclR family transcriptional regulator
VDDQENELGVNCVAVPVYLDGLPEPAGAISVSGVTFRCPLESLIAAVPDIQATIRRHLGCNAVA